ncbi:MAG: sodium:proton antiporter [Candidatus Peregrinibacteria bacterium]|nr:sodium:proton antiporter [Candidatus Peregrinibacteria bacterium]
MEDHLFLFNAIAIFSSLTFAIVIHAVCKWAKVSFPVGLLVGGFFGAYAIQNFGWSLFDNFQFSPSMVFYVFLPTLIFESAYNLNFRQFRGVFGEVALMATFGLFVSMFIVAAGLHYFLDIPWGISFLFGALISATDPVAVLAVFKELRAPKKLTTIVDGESLLNDGTALVVFQFVKAVVVSGTIFLTPKTFLAESGHFVLSLVEGLAVGTILGWVFAHAISKSKSKGVQLTLSLILAHATFLFAEGILHVSGILATMAAGMLVGNYGQRKLTAKTREIFAEIWEFMGFIANSLIFLLLGMKFVQIDFLEHWVLVLTSAGLVIFVARPFSVFLSFAISNLFRKDYEKISFSFQTIAFWGGIRGALAAAAVLLIPESFVYFPELLAMTAGTVLATFLLNVTTISALLKKLKFIDFTVSEKIQKFEAEILIDEEVRSHLEKIKDKDYISEKIFDKLEKDYSRAEDRAISNLKKLQQRLKKKSSREIEKILMYHALGIEKKCYENLLEHYEISEERFCVIRESIYRQLDRLDRDELPEERKSPIKYAPEIPKEVPEFNEIPFEGVRNFFQNLFVNYRKRKILERLQHYRARRIAGAKVIFDFEKLREHHAIFGEKDILDNIIERYKGWHKNAQEKVEQLEKKFPKIVVPARMKIAKNSCFKKERKCQKEFCGKGLISEKVYQDLKENLEKKVEDNLNESRSFFE